MQACLGHKSTSPIGENCPISVIPVTSSSSRGHTNPRAIDPKKTFVLMVMHVSGYSANVLWSFAPLQMVMVIISRNNQMDFVGSVLHFSPASAVIFVEFEQILFLASLCRSSSVRHWKFSFHGVKPAFSHC